MADSEGCKPLTEIPSLPHKLKSEDTWKKVTGILIAQGVFTELDIEPISQYCILIEQITDLRSILQDEGLIFKSRIHPALKALQDNIKICNAIGNSYGLTPLSRPRIMIEKKRKKASWEKGDDGDNFLDL